MTEGTGGGSYWGALGQVGGAVMEYEASEQRARQLRTLNRGREAGSNQIGMWDQQAEQALVDNLRSLTAARYAGRDRLVNDLGGLERVRVGDLSRQQADDSIDNALKMVDDTPIGNRSLTGNDGGFRSWGARTNARYQPVEKARRDLITHSRAQRAQDRYDTAALDRSADLDIDLNRRAIEFQRDDDLSRRRRQMMLEQLGIQYADPGPSRSQQNLAMFAGVSRAAGAYADAYASGRSSNAEVSALGYNPDTEDRGTYVTGYTYNPYGR